jgi:hypothetical protein
VGAKVATDSSSSTELRIAEERRHHETQMLLLRETMATHQHYSEQFEKVRAEAALSAERTATMSLATLERHASAASQERVLTHMITAGGSAAEFLAPIFNAGAGVSMWNNSSLLLSPPAAPPALAVAHQPQTTATMTTTTPQTEALDQLSDEKIVEKKRKMKLVLKTMESPSKIAKIKDAFDACEAEEVRRLC